MTMSKRIISIILSIALLATTFCLSSFSAFAAETDAETSSAPNAQALAAQAIDKEYRYDNDDLGATYSPESTTFKVWSPTASAVVLNLFTTGSDEEEGADKISSTNMTQVIGEDGKFTGVWSVTIAGDIKNVYYTYSITTTNTTETAKPVTYETQDIYSKATGVNGKRSMVVDLDSTDPEGWENDAHVLLNKSTDASIWEVQVKDFSYSDSSGVSKANRGKYLAFTETGTTVYGEGKVATCVDYLKELGITTVHINPFYDFSVNSIDETGPDTQYNWGYDPENYNVPEGSFSSNPYDGNVRIKECKEMIMALHNAGIQVVMDVVYNHTYSTDSSFQKTVPDYYYRFTSTGAFSNGSGCGNETATERAMFRNFVVQSCAYWVNEYHVDGFRFDLMGCMDVETMNAIRAELDKIDTRILTYGEGWSGGTITLDPTTCEGTTTYAATQGNIKMMDSRIALFNDKIRDGIKGSVFEATGQGFVQGSKIMAKNISYGVRANTVGNNGWQPSAPSQCVSYSSCHDNATLYDRLVNSTGKGASPDFTKRYSDLVEMNKLAAAIEMTSQGINFMLAGEEMARTKLGDENSYSSSPEINMIDWTRLETYGDVTSYYKGLLQIRKVFAPFTDDTNDSSANYTFTSGLTASTNVISYTVSNSTEGQWDKIAVIYNGGTTAVNTTLKDKTVTDWVIIANDKSAGLQSLGEVTGSKFSVPAASALIAVDKASFEATTLEDNTSSVILKSVYESTGEVLSTRVLKGINGTGYAATEDESIDLAYELSSITGNTTGVFGDGTDEIIFNYTDYVPNNLKMADFNEDGNVNILDATFLQMHLAKIVTIPSELYAYADVDYDGSVNISDVTTLQMYLANFSVGVGNIEVNYLDSETGKKVADSTNMTGRVGSDYTTAPKSAIGYSCDRDKLPANATGVYSYGRTVEVNYYYNYSGTPQTLHIKYAEGSPTEYGLNLWAWQEEVPQEDGTTTSVNLSKSGAWPGDVVDTTKDANGWMTAEIDTPGVGVFCFILNVGGSPQTQDYKGFTQAQDELWVVVNGSSMPNQGDWVDIYDVDPEANPDATPLA